MKTERTFFEGYLDIACGPCHGIPPPGFQPFGTIKILPTPWREGLKRSPLYISPDGQRLIAGTEELAGVDLVFARAACNSLRNRRAACENGPRPYAKRRGQPYLQPSLVNSL